MDEGPDEGGVLRWEVSQKLLAVKVAGALVFTFIAAFSLHAREQFVVACAGALVLGLLAARDVLVPVRLTADATGLTVVTGFATRNLVPWSAIEQVQVDQRQRFGLRSQLLEIDTGDLLFLLGEGDLGEPVADVVDKLRRLRGAPAA